MVWTLAAVVKVEWWDESRLRVPAALMSLAILALMALVLLDTPMARLASSPEAVPARMRLEFVARPASSVPAVRASERPQSKTPVSSPSSRADAAAERPAAPASPPLSAQRAPATEPPAVRTPAPARAAARDDALARSLYTRDGQARLPPGVAEAPAGEPEGSPPGMANARDAAKAKRVLERPNPIDYKETHFEKDWVSNGTLGDVATQKINRAISDMFKSDRSQATARPPPDTRFNPALAQNRADLGSEATGDAYKAAPIAFEKAPQPPGAAGKAIGAQLAALEQRASGCKDPRRDKWLGDVRSNLQTLDRNETALTHGADGMRAKYLLPQAIDAAYDLSRRAVWYANKQLDACVR